MRRIFRAESLGGLGKVELDDFRRARADQKQGANFRAPIQQAGDHPVKFVLAIGHAGKIALFDDRGGKTRLGENHHTRCGLKQVRAGARSDHEEECVLHLAVQPDDSRQAAEDLALSAFAQDRHAVGAARQFGGEAAHPGSATGPAVCNRAARSLRRNWPALTT